MEVICKEEQIRFTGGSGGYTWQQIVDAINSGNLSLLPEGTYLNNYDNTFTFFGGGILLPEIIMYGNISSASGQWQTTSVDWGGLSSYFQDPLFMSSQFGGSGYFGSSGYVPGGSSGGGTGSSTTYFPALNYDWGNYSQWNLEAVANVFHGMGDSVNDFGIVLTASGIGAEVGVPLMTFGGAISLIGTGIDLFIDMRDNTIQSFDYAAWAITLGLEANSIVFGKFTTTNGEKVIFELSQNGIEYIRE